MLLVTQHTATQTCRVHTTCYNKQHTNTQHMHTTQMICTSYHHQRPSSTLSMGGRRRGKWTVDVNPVNSEQHMYYIHLVIKEQHCSGECLHRRLCHNHLIHLPFALGLQPTHLLRCLLLPVWEDCLLSGPCLLSYTQYVGSLYKCPNTERTFQARNKSNSDWYNRLRKYICRSKLYMCTHCTSCGGWM